MHHQKTGNSSGDPIKSILTFNIVCVNHVEIPSKPSYSHALLFQSCPEQSLEHQSLRSNKQTLGQPTEPRIEQSSYPVPNQAEEHLHYTLSRSKEQSPGKIHLYLSQPLPSFRTRSRHRRPSLILQPCPNLLLPQPHPRITSSCQLRHLLKPQFLPPPCSIPTSYQGHNEPTTSSPTCKTLLSTHESNPDRTFSVPNPTHCSQSHANSGTAKYPD